jgi:quinoprotein glucose dehydrogenase
MGGLTSYDMNTGDRSWWIPSGGWRQQTSNDPLFAGVNLPPVPAVGGQPQVINTKTLVIYGTGRSGGAGAGRGGAGPGRAGAPATPTGPGFKLYAIDKATGKELASVPIPAPTSAVPMTFMHQGRQYIVFATGAGSNTSLVALTLPPNGGTGGSNR